MLGYLAGVILKRYTRKLKHGDKVVKGRFTDNENREIMKTIFKQNKNALKHHYTLTDPIWTELGTQLNRPPYNIFKHWEEFIQPLFSNFYKIYENLVKSLEVNATSYEFLSPLCPLFRGINRCPWKLRKLSLNIGFAWFQFDVFIKITCSKNWRRVFCLFSDHSALWLKNEICSMYPFISFVIF